MYKSGVIIGSFNPFHFGHLGLINIGLDYFENLDIYIGKRNKPYRLPHDLRTKLIETMIDKEGLGDRIKIIEANKAIDLDGSLYSGTMCGSDLLNTVIHKNPKISKKYIDYFTSFKRIITIQRNKKKLNNNAKEILNKNLDLIILEQIIPLYATELRELVQQNKDITPFIPKYIWDMISSNVSYYHKKEKII